MSQNNGLSVSFPNFNLLHKWPSYTYSGCLQGFDFLLDQNQTLPQDNLLLLLEPEVFYCTLLRRAPLFVPLTSHVFVPGRSGCKPPAISCRRWYWKDWYQKCHQGHCYSWLRDAFPEKKDRWSWGQWRRASIADGWFVTFIFVLLFSFLIGRYWGCLFSIPGLWNF